MTIQELIQKLQTFDPNLDVYIDDANWGIDTLEVKQVETFIEHDGTKQTTDYREYNSDAGDHDKETVVTISVDFK